MWQLQEAKNRLCQLVDEVQKKGPQVITRRGTEVAVLLSYNDFLKLKGKKVNEKKQSLAEFLMASPLAGSGIKIERDKSLGREIEL
ncbi:MAG: type II toxin-antitoxin system Phd/YefM family antitoxin [Candidatus Obscuribacterales bacterium]|nr:type II toxin-antitoxin system Phd/YefM family antitoxin [Candidatus Obscuribacterales bacterium]